MRGPRGATSTSVLCDKERWCTYYRGHDGLCWKLPPVRDCVCESPTVSTSWAGTKECRRCGKRVA